MSDRTFYKRQFLNSEEHGGHAFIEASIDVGSETHFDAEFNVADCSRMVSLNFGVYSADDAFNARQKIGKLRRALVAFEKELLAQLDTLQF